MKPTLRRTAVAAALVLAPVLAGCGADATESVYNPGVGVNERSGTVDVLNALVVSGADGSGSLVATLSNNDQSEADALRQVEGAGQDTGVSVDLGSPIDVQAGGSVSVSDEAEIAVQGDPVKPGAFLTMRFSFERGETVTVDVPVVARRGPYADIPVPSVAPSSATPSEDSAAH